MNISVYAKTQNIQTELDEGFLELSMLIKVNILIYLLKIIS